MNCRGGNKKARLRSMTALAVLLVLGFYLASAAGAAERVRIALSVRNVVFPPFYYAKDTRIFDFSLLRNLK